MYTFKTVTNEEQELLLEVGSLDREDNLENLRERMSKKTYNLVEKNLIELIKKNKVRDNIIVLKDLDQTSLKYEDGYRKLDVLTDIDNLTTGYLNTFMDSPIILMDRIVFDVTDKDIKYLKEKKLTKNMSKFRKLGYLPKSKGTYVLRGINNSHITYNLTPLHQDITYALAKGNNISDGELTYLIQNVFPNLVIEGLDEIETFVFNKLYVENLSFMGLLENIMRQNGIYDAIVSQEQADRYDVYDYTDDYTIYNDLGATDALNIYNYLIDVKKSILQKIVNASLKELNISLLNVDIPEDTYGVTRVGAEKPTPNNDIYMGENKVHLVPYEYEETYTRRRTRRGVGIYSSRPESIRY